MKYVCMLLGLLTGKWKVRCRDCKNLDADNKCHGHEMPAAMLDKQICCGFWGKRDGGRL